MASAAQAVPSFDADVASRLTEAQRARHRSLVWHDRLTSLWTPVFAFLIVFTVYLFFTEANTCNYLWARPLLNGFGLLMIASFFGLVLYGATGGPRVKGVSLTAQSLFGIVGTLVSVGMAGTRRNKARRLRDQADEELGEVRRLVARAKGKLSPAAYQDVVAAAAEVEVARVEGEPTVFSAKLTALSELSNKHLAAWRKASVFDFAGGFVKALAVALLIRAVIVEPFKIPSGSMIPTLEIGDQIFVNKFIYGVRIPWTNIVPFVIVRPPARGDVIVFNNPVDPDKDFIKRVIGVPGDKVEILDKVVHINGLPQPSTIEADDYLYDDQDPSSSRWYSKGATLSREALDGKPHLTLRDRGVPRNHEGPYLVPAGAVFVMGDNRDNSYDSRFGLGRPELGVQYVPFGSIKGKAMVIWLSLSKGGLLSDVFGGTGLRTDRLFRPVQLCPAESPRRP